MLILAVLGAAALLQRFFYSLFRLVLRSADVTVAAGRARASAQRGDVTGLVEGQRSARKARRGRRWDLVLALVWLVWLAGFALTGWTREAYAFAAPLWLLRAGRPSRERPLRGT